MPTATDWAEALAPRLPELLPEYASQHLELRPAGPPREFTYSRLQAFDVVAAERPVLRLALKEPFGSQGADPVAEFTALQTLYGHFAAQPGLGVPRPLLALETPPALLMEAVEGRPLLRFLLACRRPVDRSRLSTALSYASRAGAWLGHLHTLPCPSGAGPLPPLASQVEASLGILDNLGASPDRLIAIRNAVDSFGAISVAAADVTLHGDFTPRNVLCGPDLHVNVLDTTLSQRGPAAHDLGWFLAGLAFLDRWQLLVGGRLYDASALSRLRDAFLAGYRQRLELPDPQSLAFFTATRLLHRWGQYASHLKRTQPTHARVLLPGHVHPYFQTQVEGALSR